MILGQGARLFADAGRDIALDLVDSRTDSKGVTIQVYRPNGRPHYADEAQPTEISDMQYLVSVIAEDTGLATPAEMATIDVFNERIQAQGHWVFAAGLGSPSTATVIDNRAEMRCSPTGPSWSRRSTSPASG